MRSCFCAALMISAFATAGAQSSAAMLSPTETTMVRAIDAHVEADLTLLEQLVDINSGTMHPAGVEAVKDVVAPRFEALGFKVRWVPMSAQTARAGDLVAEHLCARGRRPMRQEVAADRSYGYSV